MNKISAEAIIDIKDIEYQAMKIAEKYNPQKIILFGSYGTGNPTVDSDVDLFIILESESPSLELGAEISLLLSHSFPMDIVVRTPQEVAKRIEYGDFFIKDILDNGKVLYERPS